MRIGIVTGLVSEAACLGRAGLGEGARVLCTGARPGAAARAAAALVADGCRGLVSFGTAGGLATGLAAGTVVLAAVVISDDGARLAVDPGWHQRVRVRVGGALPLVVDAIATVADPLLTPEAKVACRRATGAVAVDMESGEVARVAAAAAIPFLVVRAIADPAERTIPAWVMQAVTADGRTRITPVVAHLARRPGDAAALFRLARDARAALRGLGRVATLAGPLLALDG
ncbi:MAG: purine phosphorylase [Rhodospirillales bacterium]